MRKEPSTKKAHGATPLAHHRDKVEAHGDKPGHHTNAVPADDKSHLDDDDDGYGDLALDELEAMTIASALMKKHYVPPPAVPCAWTSWINAGDCSRSCGKGQQKQTRRKQPKAMHGGRDCQGEPEKFIPCEVMECPTTTTTTTSKKLITTTVDNVAHFFQLSLLACLVPFVNTLFV